MTNYTYNSRKLVTAIGWNVGSTGLEDPADVGFSYDNVGNRTEMTDGLGEVDYSYDSLSRMTDETRDFTDSLADAPIGGSKFNIEYSYTLNGQLKSLEDPYGQQTDYAYDKTGRLSAVTDASSFAGLSTYATSAGYRAWGGLTSLTLGNGNIQTVTFDNGLRPDSYKLAKTGTSKIQKTYEYYNDGALKYVEDELAGIYDRLQTFDHGGRLKDAKSGAEARGTTVTTNQDTTLPYRQTYGFNAFDNQTSRNNLNWGQSSFAGASFNRTDTFVNDRITTSGYVHNYDEDGRNVEMIEIGYMADSTYDARGSLIRSISGDPNQLPGYTDDIYTYYDGEGRMLKRLQKDYLYVDPQDILQGLHWVDRPLQYYIRSSVLGGEVVSEVNSTGKKLKTFVRAAGTVIAWQTLYHPTSGGPTETLRFEHTDAAGMTRKMTMENGNGVHSTATDADPAEFDPMEGNAGTENPYPTMAPPFPGEGCIGCGNNGMAILDDNNAQYVNGARVRYFIEGVEQRDGRHLSLLGFATDLDRRSNSIAGALGIVRIPGRDRDDPETPGDGPVITSSTPDIYLVSWSFRQRTNASQTGGRLSPDPPVDKTPCADMANAYQAKRDEWVKNWEAYGNSWNIYEFDQSVTNGYIGRVVKGDLGDNQYFIATKGGIGTKSFTFGQQDFKDKYLDADYDRDSTVFDADQVHHFAAYFSAGINGAYWSTTAHGFTDGAIYRSADSALKKGPLKSANEGDIKLGADAYALGERVRKNPLLLKKIGNLIKAQFCTNVMRW